MSSDSHKHALTGIRLAAYTKHQTEIDRTFSLGTLHMTSTRNALGLTRPKFNAQRANQTVVVASYVS
jgi:hypothetical protein